MGSRVDHVGLKKRRALLAAVALISVHACMRCGSQDLRLPSIARGDISYPGTDELLGVMMCARCGRRGTPLVFEGAVEAERFRAAREATGWSGENLVADTTALPTVDATSTSAAPAYVLMALGVGMGLFGAVAVAERSPSFGMAALIGLALFVMGWRLRRRRRQALRDADPLP